MKRMLKSGVLVALLLSLVGCAGLQQAAGPVQHEGRIYQGARTTTPAHVGVLVAEQSREVDREVEALNENQYFQLFNRTVNFEHSAYSPRPGFRGVSGESVILTIRRGHTVFWRQEVTLDRGIAKVVLPVGTIIATDAALCVETSFPIAHQGGRPGFLSAGRHGACSPGQALFNYLLVEGRAQTRADAYGVIALKSRG